MASTTARSIEWGGVLLNLFYAHHVLHLVGYLQSKLRGRAASSPSDVAERWTILCHSVLPFEEVLHALRHTSVDSWPHNKKACARRSTRECSIRQSSRTVADARTPWPYCALQVRHTSSVLGGKNSNEKKGRCCCMLLFILSTTFIMKKICAKYFCRVDAAGTGIYYSVSYGSCEGEMPIPATVTTSLGTIQPCSLLPSVHELVVGASAGDTRVAAPSSWPCRQDDRRTVLLVREREMEMICF